MTVIAGVDVGNATTEVVLLSGAEILGAGRVPTRGRKGSADSLRGAAALVRRVERQPGCTVTEARIAPLRAVDTSVLTVPDAAAPAGGCGCWPRAWPTPGGTGGPASGGRRPLLRRPVHTRGRTQIPAARRWWRWCRPACATTRPPPGCGPCWRPGCAVGAVLVAGDEGVLVANRLPAGLPVIDQVDAAAAAACLLLAVEVRPPGHTLRLLADPVALGARLGLDEAETGDAAR